MQKFQFIVIILGLAIGSAGQQKKIDSIQRLIASATSDTARIALLDLLSDVYRENREVDSCILARKQALALNEKTNYSLLLQCWQNAGIGYMLFETGNYTESLKYAVQHLALSEKLNDTAQQGAAHLVFGHDYRELGFYRESLKHYFEAAERFKRYHEGRGNAEDNKYTFGCIAQVYLKMNKLDSALFFTNKSYQQALASNDRNLVLFAHRIFGDLYRVRGDDETAMQYYRQYVPEFDQYKEINRDLGFVFNGMALIFQKRNQRDSAILYANKALANALLYHDQENIFAAANLLYDLFKNDNEHQAFTYFKMATAARDSIATADKLKHVQVLAFNEQLRENERNAARAMARSKTRIILVIAGILIGIASFLIWNRIRQLRLKYEMMLQQTENEKLKAKYEKELLELEARALRAQMNPHFIFNCLNSIKSLMQEGATQKGVSYLTTFSKLIRMLFNNADKKEIALVDEIETCRLYLQLESMRFDGKLSFSICMADNADLKSVHVPVMIIQPFIENAIWHGIAPRQTGGHIDLNVKLTDGQCIVQIDDNGIGRDLARQNSSADRPGHQSKGVQLTQSRLKLSSQLYQRKATVVYTDKKDEEGKGIGTLVSLTWEGY